MPNLEEQLQEFQQKYTNLEQQAEPGSLDRHVYEHIVRGIQTAPQGAPAKQRAFEMQLSLVSMARVLDPPSERHVVWKAVRELEQIADLPHFR